MKAFIELASSSSSLCIRKLIAVVNKEIITRNHNNGWSFKLFTNKIKIMPKNKEIEDRIIVSL